MDKKSNGKQVKRTLIGQKLVERNLAKINPLKEQFEPSGKDPVAQHKKMAGMK
jgi:hypothetical protein